MIWKYAEPPRAQERQPASLKAQRVERGLWELWFQLLYDGSPGGLKQVNRKGPEDQARSPRKVQCEQTV